MIDWDELLLKEQQLKDFQAAYAAIQQKLSDPGTSEGLKYLLREGLKARPDHGNQVHLLENDIQRIENPPLLPRR